MASILANKEAFQKAATNAQSIKEFLIYLGLRPVGSNYKQAKKYSSIHQIDLPYCSPSSKTLNAHLRITIPLNEILVENSTYTNRTNIKKRCYSEGLLIEQCYSCGSGPWWNNKPLILQLEHINGIPNDNRLENLSILCPNCHTQTDTFCGKQLRKARAPKSRITKINWPPISDLIDMVNNSSYTSVAKRLGVSDNAVRKRIKTHS